MASIDEVLAEAENPQHRRVAVARVLLRQDLVHQHAELSADLERLGADSATMNPSPEVRALAQQVRDVEEEMDKAKAEFRFQAIGRRAWVDLLAAHPPTKRQLADLAAQQSDGRRASLEFNPETFPIAAMAASAVDPEMTEDDARRLESALTDQQWTDLFSAALNANVGSAPKASRAAGLILRLSEQSATTAAPAESDAPTS